MTEVQKLNAAAKRAQLNLLRQQLRFDREEVSFWLDGLRFWLKHRHDGNRGVDGLGPSYKHLIYRAIRTLRQRRTDLMKTLEKYYELKESK